MRKIISVKALDFVLECEMENGDFFKYDMSFVKSESSEMIKPLQDLTFFKEVFLELGSLAWPNGYDIHAETVVRDGEQVSQVAS